MKLFKGFTLLEVIITISLTLLVLTLITSAFFLTTSTLSDIRKKNLQTLEYMKVYAQMRRQLLELYYSPGIKFASGRGNLHMGESENSQIQFLTSKAFKYRGIIQAEYKILHDEKENEDYLAYREFPYPVGEFLSEEKTNSFKNVKWEIFSKFINGLEINFYNQKENQASQSKNREEEKIPSKIQVILWHNKNKKDSNNFIFYITAAIYQEKE